MSHLLCWQRPQLPLADQTDSWGGRAAPRPGRCWTCSWTEAEGEGSGGLVNSVWWQQGGSACALVLIQLLFPTCWNWGELSVFWISSADCGKLSPLGRKGSSLCWTSALVRMGAIISGVQTLARSTGKEDTRWRWWMSVYTFHSLLFFFPFSSECSLYADSSPAVPWAADAGTFMVARMLWRSLSWMGWCGVGLPTEAGARGVGAAAANHRSKWGGARRFQQKKGKKKNVRRSCGVTIRNITMILGQSCC